MYPTDLTDSQWQVIEGILNDQRKRKHSLRSVFNAIVYVAKTGCQWRMIPQDLPYWQLSYYYFWKWRNEGRWETMNKALRELRRKKAKREASPSVAVIDSQSIKCSEWGVPRKGYDGHKKVQGRKRHILVDTLGLVLLAVVGAANEHDSKAARSVFPRLASLKYTRLTKILADSAYGKELAKWVKKT